MVGKRIKSRASSTNSSRRASMTLEQIVRRAHESCAARGMSGARERGTAARLIGQGTQAELDHKPRPAAR